MKKFSMTAVAAFVFLGQTFAQEKAIEQQKPNSMNKATLSEQYTFELNNKVTRQKVSFKTRYGITLSGDLYLPKEQGNEPLSGIVISGPFGAVKEQSSGVYANQMAARGFAALAFDPSYTGESGGEPRHISSPDINTEDFSAAVDFLGIQKNVDRNKIGVIGICGFGGFALNAVAVDKRVKAVATTSLYDISRVSAKGYNDKMNADQRTKVLEQMSEQRWKDAENGKPALGPKINPVKLTGVEPQFIKDYFDYYRTQRGFHPKSPNSNGSWTATNGFSFMNQTLLTNIKEISPRPILLIAGANAHSRYMSEDVYKAAAEPKELLIIPNGVHVDLYDKINVIPFDKLEKFFKDNLK